MLFVVQDACFVVNAGMAVEERRFSAALSDAEILGFSPRGN